MIILNLMSLILLEQSNFFPIIFFSKLDKGNARPGHPYPQYNKNVNQGVNWGFIGSTVKHPFPIEFTKVFSQSSSS